MKNKILNHSYVVGIKNHLFINHHFFLRKKYQSSKKERKIRQRPAANQKKKISKL